ncbi:MAG: hypothetical protein HYZ57_08435 [Acidobacteria bacterium]|nr:hypothetical protein [Acidobacteriota bacterium]
MAAGILNPPGDIVAEEKTFQAKYVGSGTFIISKPKRNRRKLRQARVKNRRRGMRK